MTDRLSNENFVCFSISNEENAITPEDIENAQFTKVHFRIYSADRVNDHNYTCSLKVLKLFVLLISFSKDILCSPSALI